MPRVFSMIEGILTLLFSSLIKLTPVPIDIQDAVELQLSVPVSALTNHAMLQVQLSETELAIVGVEKVPSIVSREFAPGDISAKLVDSGSRRQILFVYRGIYVQSKEGVRLVLEPEEAVPTKSTFDRLTIETKNPIKGVTIYWRDAGAT